MIILSKSLYLSLFCTQEENYAIIQARSVWFLNYVGEMLLSSF
jgi:hypothetical protein